MTPYETEQAALRAGTLALRTAVAIMRDRDEASDVAHDVVVDVLRSLDQLRDPAAFDAWVHKITVRHALRALKKRRARGGVEVPLALIQFDDEPAAAEVDRDLILAARGALGQALTTLPPRQRLAVALRYVHDLGEPQIAEALGCRRGTVKALLSRARTTLRETPALNDLRLALTEGEA